MRRNYGTKEQAKREIFARSASYHYLGNGRYGLAAASEYYFGKPLSSYTLADAAQAASLAGISKSPRDYAPAPGNPRSLRAATRSWPSWRATVPYPRCRQALQAEPVRVTPEPAQDPRPAAIEDVFSELNRHGGSGFGSRTCSRADLGQIHGGDGCRPS